MDLIERQAAIDAINHICPVDTEYDCTLLDRVDVRCVLSDLPSAQRWIPCSERLPKKGNTVLITNNRGNVRCGQYRGLYGDEINEWWWKKKTIETVLAWMPLPEPYKERREDAKIQRTTSKDEKMEMFLVGCGWVHHRLDG